MTKPLETFHRLGLALFIGALGGSIFYVLGIPLAWMLGAMAFNALAALCRAPVAVPDRVRTPMQALIGIYIGSSFSPETVARIGEWPWSIAALAVFMVVSTALIALYYRRLAGFDKVTALFSATPGGMVTMVGVGGALGADERRIALAQALRVTLVVLTIPPLVFAFNHQPPPATGLETVVSSSGILDLLILVSGGILGFLAAQWTRLPGGIIIGPMLVSAALYATGMVHLEMPRALVQAVLLVLGSAVGARFAGVALAELLAVGRHALLAVMINLALAASFAALVSAALGIDYLAALLALAPGGVAEMCLIAVALHIDPVFVATHHLARLLLLMGLMPLVGKWYRADQ